MPSRSRHLVPLLLAALLTCLVGHRNCAAAGPVCVIKFNLDEIKSIFNVSGRVLKPLSGVIDQVDDAAAHGSLFLALPPEQGAWASSCSTIHMNLPELEYFVNFYH